jgi:hypothetical protein
MVRKFADAYNNADGDAVDAAFNEMTEALWECPGWAEAKAETAELPTGKEQRIVFAVALDSSDSVPLVLLGMPAGAWTYIKDGMTSTFDLTKAGIPVKLMIFGSATHDSVMELMNRMMAESFSKDIPIVDRRGEDFSIKPRE